MYKVVIKQVALNELMALCELWELEKLGNDAMFMFSGTSSLIV